MEMVECSVGIPEVPLLVGGAGVEWALEGVAGSLWFLPLGMVGGASPVNLEARCCVSCTLQSPASLRNDA